MTGLLLATEFRQIRPEMPVIMMTGYTAPRMSERVAAAGIYKLLLKPVTLHSLGVAVREALTSVSTPWNAKPALTALPVPATRPLRRSGV
jgi:DNA-binding NtrC family response regulator